MSWLKGPKTDGVTQINIPVKFNKQVQSAFFEPWADVWYVDGTNGSDNYTGKGPSVAKATIQAAVTAASRGDVIYVRPKTPTYEDSGYYNESIVTAYADDGLNIIGISGASAPHRSPVPVRVLIPKTENLVGLTVNNAHFNCENIYFQMPEDRTATAPLYLVTLANSSGSAAGHAGASFFNCIFQSGQFRTLGGRWLSLVNCYFNQQFKEYQGYELWIDCSTTPGWSNRIIGCWFGAGSASAVALRYARINGSQWDVLIDSCFFDRIPDESRFWENFGVVNGLMTNCFFNEDAVTCGTSGKEILIGSGQFEVVGCHDRTGLIATT